MQCGRKADSMKFWFMWKARGDKGMEEHVDTAFERARYFQQKIRESDGFELVMDQVKYPLRRHMSRLKSIMTS